MLARAAAARSSLLGSLLLASALASGGCSNATCKTLSADVSDVCLPDTIAANREATLQVREACALNCARLPGCTATLRSGSVILDLHHELCDDVGTDCATNLCLQRVANCRIPKLGPGDYPLVAPGAAPRTLHVVVEGASSCIFPAASTP